MECQMFLFIFFFWEKNESQEGLVSLTWVPGKWPLGGIIFYLRTVIWTSQLDIPNEVSSQLAFLSRGSGWK